MVIVDANVLLYAVNEQSHHHRDCVKWLDAALAGGQAVGFSWIALLAFVRLGTSRAVFPEPLSVEQAFAQLDSWLAAPGAVVVEPAAGHAGTMRRLLTAAGVAGDLVSDAHLAAIAVAHDATIISYDRDFARFDGVGVAQPG